MNDQTIELYKMRDFGEKFNATIVYIRHNFLDLIKVSLLIAAPLGLILGIVLKSFFQSIMSMSSYQGEASNPEEAFAMAGTMGGYMFIIILLSVVGYGLSMAGIMGYMRLKHERGTAPSISETYGFALKKLPGLIGLVIVSYIIIMIGFVFLVIPGIYLMIVLVLAVPTYIFQDEGFGNALSQPFKLINEKWWSTFGLLFITGVVASICSYIFAIPYYALTMTEALTPESATGPEAMSELFTSWKTSLSMAFMFVGTYITYMIPIIAICFQYFNLRERKDATGLKSQIENFEQLD